MTDRSEECLSDEVERLIDARMLACRKLRGARKRGEEESMPNKLCDNYRRVRKGVSKKIKKEKKELGKRRVRNIREHGGTSFKLFRTDLTGKRKERRLNRV